MADNRVEISIAADPLTSTFCRPQKKFWRCVRVVGRLAYRVEPPTTRIEAVRIVDMSASNSWAESAGILRRPAVRS